MPELKHLRTAIPTRRTINKVSQALDADAIHLCTLTAHHMLRSFERSERGRRFILLS